MEFKRFIEELKNRISIIDVIGKDVSLKDSGRGNYKGLCPFHKEKTPSFTVNSNGMYYCFGCGEKGDAINYLQKKMGLNFIESVEYLANLAGMEVPKSNIQKPNPEKEKLRNILEKILKESLLFYKNSFKQSIGANALKYAKKRGFTAKTIEEFSICYAPLNNALLNFLLKKNYKYQEIEKTGLIRKDKEGKYYETFRNRIMFPIFDIKGQPIAFGGRVLDDKLPKYINSPETEIFIKSNILYNYHNVIKSRNKKYLIITEGYVDTIALSNIGITNVVATLGTAVSEQHINLAWRINNNPIFCFDGDQAGFKAMVRAANLVLPMLKPGFSLSFAILPNGLDPDDTINKHGKETIINTFRNAQTLSDFIFNFSSDGLNLNTPEGKAALENEVMKLCDEIKDNITSGHFRRFFKDKLWQVNKNNSLTKKVTKHSNLMNIQPENDIDYSNIETKLLVFVAKYPEILKQDEIYEEWLAIDFHSKKLDKMYNITLDTNFFENVDSQYWQSNSDYNQIMHLLKKAKEKGLMPESNDEEHKLCSFRYLLSQYYFTKLNKEYQYLLSQMNVDAEEKAKNISKEMTKYQEIMADLEAKLS